MDNTHIDSEVEAIFVVIAFTIGFTVGFSLGLRVDPVRGLLSKLGLIWVVVFVVGPNLGIDLIDVIVEVRGVDLGLTTSTVIAL